MKIGIINGPNLNLLGKREPEIYGSTSFEEYLETLKSKYSQIDFQYFQSNGEQELIEAIQQMNVDFIILNAGAFTHTSIALSDAVMAVSTPVIEVHISNVHQRESFRHHSYISAYAMGVIVGFGLDGYRLGVEACLNQRD
jgi:3-dehydroquinate dehydratase-2